MKWLKRIIVSLLGMGLLLLVLLLLDPYEPPQTAALGQKARPVKRYDSLADAQRFQQLKDLYGKNKVLPKGYEQQALVALSHYPELVGVPMKFVVEEAIVPLASRPEPGGVLFPWQERLFCIIISNGSLDELEPILLHNMDYNAQIGVLGHEIAHTVDYLDKSSLQLAQIALSYFSGSFRKKFERDTDKRTIAHGLGYQLLAWARHVREAMGGEEPAEGSVGDAYLSPSEIEEEIRENHYYN